VKTARVQVLTTPAFRDWLRKEARNAGVSVGEFVRSRCEGKSSEEEKAVETGGATSQGGTEGAILTKGQRGRCERNAAGVEGGAGTPQVCGAPMSILAQTVEAIRDAMKLAEDVRRASATLDEMTREIRDHDRRITRLEAQWDTAALLSRSRLE
jgi:hypothetical protein